MSSQAATLAALQRPHTCQDWLPVTVHDGGLPINVRHHAEWGIESAVRVYTHTDDCDALDVIRVFRPDLTLGQISDHVRELCRLSCKVEALNDNGRLVAADAAFEDYRGYLYNLATKPVTP